MLFLLRTLGTSVAQPSTPLSLPSLLSLFSASDLSFVLPFCDSLMWMTVMLHSLFIVRFGSSSPLRGEARSSGTPESCRATFGIGDVTFKQFSDSGYEVSITMVLSRSLIRFYHFATRTCRCVPGRRLSRMKLCNRTQSITIPEDAVDTEESLVILPLRPSNVNIVTAGGENGPAHQHPQFFLGSPFSSFDARLPILCRLRIAGIRVSRFTTVRGVALESSRCR